MLGNVGCSSSAAIDRSVDVAATIRRGGNGWKRLAATGVGSVDDGADGEDGGDDGVAEEVCNPSGPAWARPRVVRVATSMATSRDGEHSVGLILRVVFIYMCVCNEIWKTTLLGGLGMGENPNSKGFSLFHPRVV